MRPKRALLGALMVAAILAFQALPASAFAGTATDPNDVPGKLDLYKLHFTKMNATSPLHIVVRTYGPWAKSVLEGNQNKLIVYLDADRDGSVDYHARIKKIGDKLVVLIAGSGSAFEPVPAHKPNGRTVTFTIPGGSPPNPNGMPPQMRAYSLFTEGTACDTGCIDKAPNSGWL
jgi:hypothetical protein